eukprot:768045-Hanusia_phi.AAC.3
MFRLVLLSLPPPSPLPFPLLLPPPSLHHLPFVVGIRAAAWVEVARRGGHGLRPEVVMVQRLLGCHAHVRVESQQPLQQLVLLLLQLSLHAPLEVLPEDAGLGLEFEILHPRQLHSKVSCDKFEQQGEELQGSGR